MKLKMYAIFDTATEAYMTPWFMVNRASALRAFNDLAKDPQSNVYKHPADYILYEVGTWDDNTGEMDEIKLSNLGHASTQKEFPAVDKFLANHNADVKIVK